MKLHPTSKIAGVLSIASLLIAGATYFLLRLNECPSNSDVAQQQYRDNQPVLPGKFIINDNQKAIANVLVSFWLNWFTSPYADARIKLEEFEVQGIEVGPWNGDRFMAVATVSVRPAKCSFEDWRTGKGEHSGDWVRNKPVSFTIVRDGDSYKVANVGMDMS
jgi:hypothetical protein